MKNNKVLLWVGFLLSFFFLFLVLKDFNVKKLGPIISNANVLYLFLATLIYFIAYLLRAIRWKFFYGKDVAIELKDAVGSFFIGNFGNNIFPARLGDLWRILLLYERNSTPKSLALAATIVERIFDTMAILISGLVAISLSKLATTYRIVLIGLFLLIVVAFLVAWYMEERYEEKIHFHPRIVWLFKNLKLAFAPFRKPKVFLLLFLLTIVSWGIELISFYYFLLAFSLRANIALLTLVLFFINIAVSLPSAPSNIGTFEYGFVLAGTSFGLDKSHIFTVALVAHFFRFLANVLPGVIFSSLWHFKMNTKK